MENNLIELKAQKSSINTNLNEIFINHSFYLQITNVYIKMLIKWNIIHPIKGTFKFSTKLYSNMLSQEHNKMIYKCNKINHV